MPTPEQQPHDQAGTEALTGDVPEQIEQRFKTIAVRVGEQLHSQLQFLAQLSGTSISEEIRTAIQGRITAAHDDPELVARAQQVREEIERDAAARTAAIAGFMGHKATAGTAKKPGTARAGRSKSDSE